MDVQEHMPADEVVAGIKAELQRYEAERARANASVKWRVPLFLGLLVAAAASIAVAFNGLASTYEQWLSTPHVFLYVIAFVASFFIYSRAMRPATRLQQSFREKILPVVFGFISDVGYRHGHQPDSFDRLPRETMDTFNRQSFDDVISGTYEDFPFELYEATLSNKAGKSASQIFKGVIVAFETITPFSGLLVAAAGRAASPSSSAESSARALTSWKAGFRKSTAPMNSAPTMPTPRGRW